MSSGPDKVLVIIVTFNGMKWLKECLESVRNSTIPADLFIVDNGSTDGSIEFIKSNYPEAKLIESKENLGFGKANNLGFEYALKNYYDYVYLLNQDAWIEPDLLDKMIEVSKNHPEYGVLSPLQTNKEKSKLDHNFSSCIPKELTSDILCSERINQIYECHFAMAAHWLIPISALSKIGGFSPAFPHYGEDDNYIQRTQYRGFKVGIIPNCYGVHDRENRPMPLSKERYLNYIHQLTLFNNPYQRHRFLKGIKRYLGILISTPKVFPWKYLSQSITGYFSSIQYRNAAKNDGAFLNLDKK